MIEVKIRMDSGKEYACSYENESSFEDLVSSIWHKNDYGKTIKVIGKNLAVDTDKIESIELIQQ